MTWLQGHTREVYRVYGEDEFLDGVQPADGFLDAARADDVLGPGTRGTSARPGHVERRLRRLAGAAVLAGAVGAVGGVIAAAAISSGRDTTFRPPGGSAAAARGSSPRRAQPPEVDTTAVAAASARTAAVSAAARAVGHWLGHARGAIGGHGHVTAAADRRGSGPQLPVAVDRAPARASSVRGLPGAEDRPREDVEFGFEQ